MGRRNSGGPAEPEPEERPDDRERRSADLRANLRPGVFITAVVAQVRAEPLPGAPDLQAQARGRLAKFWTSDDQSVHYEVWLHEREARLEVGFHLESDAETNRAIYRELDLCLLEIQSALGPSVWLEEWDRGWARLYETQPLYPLDDERVAEVADRVREFISVVEPLYRAIEARLSSAA